MPKLQPSNLIGLAGEYLVGAVVAQKLGWPYRMQPIADIGIDGEVEALDDGGRTTGRLLKVQVKAAVRSTRRTRYVQRDHFEYWQELAVPVIVAHPLVGEMKVVWFELKHGRPAGDSFAFDINSGSELNAESRPRLLQLSVQKNQFFDPMVGTIRRLLEDTLLHDAVHDAAVQFDYTPPDDLDSVENLMKFGKMMERWKILKELASVIDLRPRAQAELDRLQHLVDLIERRVEAVALRRPIRDD